MGLVRCVGATASAAVRQPADGTGAATAQRYDGPPRFRASRAVCRWAVVVAIASAVLLMTLVRRDVPAVRHETTAASRVEIDHVSERGAADGAPAVASRAADEKLFGGRRRRSAADDPSSVVASKLQPVASVASDNAALVAPQTTAVEALLSPREAARDRIAALHARIAGARDVSSAGTLAAPGDGWASDAVTPSPTAEVTTARATVIETTSAAPPTQAPRPFATPPPPTLTASRRATDAPAAAQGLFLDDPQWGDAWSFESAAAAWHARLAPRGTNSAREEDVVVPPLRYFMPARGASNATLADYASPGSVRSIVAAVRGDLQSRPPFSAIGPPPTFATAVCFAGLIDGNAENARSSITASAASFSNVPHDLFAATLDFVSDPGAHHRATTATPFTRILPRGRPAEAREVAALLSAPPLHGRLRAVAVASHLDPRWSRCSVSFCIHAIAAMHCASVVRAAERQNADELKYAFVAILRIGATVRIPVRLANCNSAVGPPREPDWLLDQTQRSRSPLSCALRVGACASFFAGMVFPAVVPLLNNTVVFHNTVTAFRSAAIYTDATAWRRLPTDVAVGSRDAIGALVWSGVVTAMNHAKRLSGKMLETNVLMSTAAILGKVKVEAVNFGVDGAPPYDDAKGVPVMPSPTAAYMYSGCDAGGPKVLADRCSISHRLHPQYLYEIDSVAPRNVRSCCSTRRTCK